MKLFSAVGNRNFVVFAVQLIRSFRFIRFVHFIKRLICVGNRNSTTMRKWGHMVKVYGVKTITLSPMALDPWRTLPKDWVNVFKRYVVDYWWKPGIPLGLAYMYYAWGKKENERINRKDPKAFLNDE